MDYETRQLVREARSVAVKRHYKKDLRLERELGLQPAGRLSATKFASHRTGLERIAQAGGTVGTTAFRCIHCLRVSPTTANVSKRHKEDCTWLRTQT